MYEYIPDNPYLLLTPGPLSTSKGVRNALLQDWCTWDKDYNENIVQDIRRRLTKLATQNINSYTTVLMQGSGSFSVESTLGSVIPPNGKLLIIQNGAYGKRMIKMAEILKLNFLSYDLPETETPSARKISEILSEISDITHVALVHCETTTGILNPLIEIAAAVKSVNKIFILDAMSSFGGIPMDIDEIGVDFLISSSNKCIQGVPGFGFVIAKRTLLEGCKGNARSLCFDLYDQWNEMENTGKWRYTSPTHVVRAFHQALNELDIEGGITARNIRYSQNHTTLANGMKKLGFEALLENNIQSPIITSYLYPNDNFDFEIFYQAVKKHGFILYPGKISQANTFRIGNIGEIYPMDIIRLLEAIETVMLS